MSARFTKDQNNNFMDQLDKIIRQNLQTPNLTNAHLANLAHMSVRQFYRKVEVLTGLSPNQYIRKIRLQKAAQLLENGEHNTVKEVALRVGFTKVSYFSKLFEQWYGQHPSSFLKKRKRPLF